MTKKITDTSVGIEACAIHKSFHHPTEVHILKGVNLKVKKGESVAIMGASGEGKSTLLHILGFLEPPCRGTLHIANNKSSNKNHATIRSQHIGFIFQAYNLLEDYTCLENILMPARIARKNTSKGSECYKRALQLLEEVGLTKRANFLTKLLSGGEKQRVAIARAFCNNPDIILADEPSGNLDHDTSEKIHELLLSSSKNNGKTLLVATHDKELAKLCDRCYLLQDGKLISTKPFKTVS